MVKRLRPALLLTLLLAVAAGTLSVLGSCELFSSSLFPGYLSRVVAARNLDPELRDLVDTYGWEWGCDLVVLRTVDGASPVDYLALLVGAPGTNRLLILDSDLTVLKELQDLPTGSRAMVDAAGKLVVGRVVFDPATGDDYLIEPNEHFLGFAYGGQNFLVWTDMNQLWYESYDVDWATQLVAPTPALISGGVSGNWQLHGLGCDPKKAGQEVVLVLYSEGDGQEYVVYTDQEQYKGATLPGDFFNSCPSYPRPPDTWDRIYYTRKGLVMRGLEDLYYLYSLTLDPDSIGSDDVKSRHDVRVAYDIDGTYGYYFDRIELNLYKGRTGW
jgi:hypothetical protein